MRASVRAVWNNRGDDGLSRRPRWLVERTQQTERDHLWMCETRNPTTLMSQSRQGLQHISGHTECQLELVLRSCLFEPRSGPIGQRLVEMVMMADAMLPHFSVADEGPQLRKPASVRHGAELYLPQRDLKRNEEEQQQQRGDRQNSRLQTPLQHTSQLLDQNNKGLNCRH